MEIKRSFLPGSEWLYFKIYCGKSFSNELLGSDLFPYTEELLKKKLISKWFFIRYRDPEYHIRFRLKIKDSKKTFNIISKLEKLLNLHFEQGLVWNLQLATYNRELERYKPFNITKCESLFFEESKLVSNITINISIIDDHVICTMAILNHYLKLFFENHEMRVKFLTAHLNSFKEEFKVNTSQLKKMNLKYRNLKIKNGDLATFFNSKKARLYNSFLENTERLIDQIHDSKEIAGSIIHMFVNRLFYSNQREMELVLYHHLHKYHTEKKYHSAIDQQ